MWSRALAYAGSQGRHLNGARDLNQPLPVTAPTQSGCLAPNQSPSASYDFDPCLSGANGVYTSPDYTRPYQGYTGITNFQWDWRDVELQLSSVGTAISRRKG